jgi:hypothetical protein
MDRCEIVAIVKGDTAKIVWGFIPVYLKYPLFVIMSQTSGLNINFESFSADEIEPRVVCRHTIDVSKNF